MPAGADQEPPVISETVELSVSNIGGIDEMTVTFQEGVTVLSGRNATNRTSLLQGIMAALGSDRASLKADKEEAAVTLEAEEVYHRRFRRKNDTVISEGQPYLDDSELADLFAFLLESNEARRAVASGDDLRKLIMQPIDTAEIRREIDRLETQKRELDDQLSELADLEQSLPGLRQERQELEDEIERLREQLGETRERLDAAEPDPAENELESTLDTLEEARAEIERVRDRIRTERESIDALEAERESLRESLSELSGDGQRSPEQLETEIERLRKKKADLDDEIAQLQTTVQFNQEQLDGSGSIFDDDSENVTDELVPDREEMTCWTCGSSVEAAQIEQTIDQLRQFRQTKLTERNELDTELTAKLDRKQAIESNRREREQVEERLSAVESELEQRQERREALIEQRQELVDRIERLETTVDDREPTNHGDVLDVQKEVSRLSVRLENRERKREEIESKIERINEQVEQRTQLREQREQVTAQLTDLRTRIDRIEADAVAEFNEHMANLLDMLGYENIERIWIERLSKDESPREQSLSASSFELRIVRTTEDGAAYEDSIDHLSESESEVTGLVFALAGYLVHDLHETVPFMLLDSLEAIDAERIATLVEYFQAFVPYLVVALLEEDAQALAGDHDVISTI